MMVSVSPEITITPAAFRQAVEDITGCVSDEVWQLVDLFSRQKLALCRFRHPEVDYYDDLYLIELAVEMVEEVSFSSRTFFFNFLEVG